MAVWRYMVESLYFYWFILSCLAKDHLPIIKEWLTALFLIPESWILKPWVLTWISINKKSGSLLGQHCIPFDIFSVIYFSELDLLLNKLRFKLSCKSWVSLRKIWDVSVWSDKCKAFTINVWRAIYSVQCVVWSIHVQIQVQVQVQYVMYTVQCSGWSINS